MELERTDFDLFTAIDNALTLVRERAGRRGIALDRAVDSGLGSIRGDERKVSLARRFIEPHGGRIWMKSQTGQGSTFTFTLPARREE